MIGNLIGGIIAIIVGVVIFDEMRNMEFSTIPNDSSLKVFVDYLPFVFMAVIVVYHSLREAGLMTTEEYREEYESRSEEENHKQTYEEYVRERLEVEKMMR